MIFAQIMINLDKFILSKRLTSLVYSLYIVIKLLNIKENYPIRNILSNNQLKDLLWHII